MSDDLDLVGRLRNAAEETWSPSRAVTIREAADEIERLRAAEALAIPVTGGASFQERVAPWMQETFGPEISADRLERCDRLIEETFELVQALNYPRDRIGMIADYTYSRAVGDASQEVGGVMVCLAALCLAAGLDMHEAAETELARIWTKVEAIRAKQKTKPKGSPLPVPTGGGEVVGGGLCAEPYNTVLREPSTAANERQIGVTDTGIPIIEGPMRADAPPPNPSDSSALPQHLLAEATAALEPFAEFAAGSKGFRGFVNNDRWRATPGRVVDWFGPSDFARAAAAHAKLVELVAALESAVEYGSGTPKTSTPEAEQAAQDANTLGVGVLFDGKRVAPEDFYKPAPTPPAVTREEIAIAIWKHFYGHMPTDSAAWDGVNDLADQLLSLLGAHHDG